MKRPRTFIGLVALCLVLTACGTRRSHDEVLRAAGGSGNLVDSQPRGASDPTSATGAEVEGTSGTTSVGAVDQPANASGSGSTGSRTAGGVSGGTGTGGRAAGSAAGGSGAGAAPAAAKSVVRIGLVGSLAGAAGEAFRAMPQAVQVWVRFINDRGGLNGHRVELLVGDDGGDPSQHRAIVQEFVEVRHVIAFVANPEALTGPGSIEYLTKVGAPVIGSEGAGDWFYSSPVYFPQGSSGLALLQAGVAINAKHMHQRGLKKFGLITCVEVQVCRDAYNKTPALYAKYGIEAAYRGQVSIAQPDFTAECLNAQRSGAQAISIGLPANQIRNFTRACARQNYRPLIGISAGAAVDAQRTDPNLKGMLVFSITGPWTSSSKPLTKEFRDAMAAYAPTVVPTGAHSLAWTAAKVLELAGKDLPEPATRRDVLQRLWALHGDLLPELTGPLLFNPGRTATRTACNFASVVQNERFVPANGGERVCVDYDPRL